MEDTESTKEIATCQLARYELAMTKYGIGSS
jgi:hypothetical protein